MDTRLLDDLAQDVMEKLLSDGRKVLRRFAGTREAAFAVYIQRIAESILLDQHRRDAFRREVEQSIPPEEFWRIEAALAESPLERAGEDPEAAVRRREMLESVERTLPQISLDDRQHALNRLLFRLYFDDRYSIPQIGRLRAIPLSVSSVARRINLIRSALKRSWAPARQRVAIRPAAARTQKNRTQKKQLPRDSD